jgi:hypothetical protein
MKMQRLLLAALIGAVLATGLTFGIQAAAQSSTTYYACLKTGKLTEVGTSSPTCRSGATVISLNSQGPQGPSGISQAYSASNVDNAISGAGPIAVESLSVPEGDYVINAQVNLTAPPADAQTVQCSLISDTAGTVTVSAPTFFVYPSVAATMDLSATVANTSTISVQCDNNSSDSYTAGSSITATAVDAIN